MSGILALLAKLATFGSGFRTYIGAAILLLNGLAALLTGIGHVSDGGLAAAWPEIQAALASLGTALAAFGLRQAITKSADATQAAAGVPQALRKAV